MKTYSSAWLTFSVKIGNHFKELLEEQGALRKYNQETGADLGFLEAGRYRSQELFVTAYARQAEPLEPVQIDLTEFDSERTAVWSGQIQRFLRSHDIPPIDDVAVRLIANLDD